MWKWSFLLSRVLSWPWRSSCWFHPSWSICVRARGELQRRHCGCMFSPKNKHVVWLQSPLTSRWTHLPKSLIFSDFLHGYFWQNLDLLWHCIRGKHQAGAVNLSWLSWGLIFVTSAYNRNVIWICLNWIELKYTIEMIWNKLSVYKWGLRTVRL